MTLAMRLPRVRWIAMGVLGAAIALVWFVFPVFGVEDPDADRLRLTPDTKAFYYGAVDPGSATVFQPVAVSGTKGCEISTLTGPLVTLSSNSGSGGIKGPGYVDYGIGVKSGGSNGTPCAEIDGGEKLTISTPNAWSGARLDVEVKGGVSVVAEMRDGNDLIATHKLATGTTGVDDGPPYEAFTNPGQTQSACAFPNDSGPDANIKDNCQWNIDTGAAFDSITLYAEDGIGTVSLEGGADYLGFDPAGAAAGMYDTVFYRAISPQDDTYTTDEDTPLSVNAAQGVLANDGTSVATVSLDTDVTNGTLNLNSDGSFSYDPDLNFNGSDSFTYFVNDGAGARVTINVTPVNDAPEIVAGPLPAAEDAETTFTPDELATDVDGDPLTIVDVSADQGTADIDQDGNVAYTPPEGFCGTISLELTVEVGDGTTTTTGTISIDVACEADDDSYSMDAREGTANGSQAATLQVGAPGVLANDANPGDGATASLLSGPVLAGSATGEGTLNLSSDGSFTFTPAFRTEADWIEDFGDATSYDVEWTYSAIYTDQDPQPATVTITVNRNLCELDTVSGGDGNVFGEFELLESSGCKAWVPVEADGEADTIVFEPDSPDTTAVYDGTLTIFDLEVADGSLATVILRWDATPDEQVQTDYEAIPSCSLVEGEIVLPGNPEQPSGWCFYDLDSVLVGEQLWDITWKVRGWDDPGFSFR